MDLFYTFFRSAWQNKQKSRYLRIIKKTNQLETYISVLSDDDLNRKIKDLDIKAQSLKSLGPILSEALAIGREVSKRQLDMRHYDVQLMGTLALYEGHIAEMNTGEGKTLMAPLAAYLHHLGNYDKSVHIVTANEYLAARDAQWMAPFLKALNLSVGLILPGMPADQRVAAYERDVLYSTGKEIVFDSLREPMKQKKLTAADSILRPKIQNQINAKYDFAIVDEVDSVLIDQARSPLSIGSDSGISAQIELYKAADAIAGQMVRGTHYRLMNDDRKIEMKDQGKAEARSKAGSALRLLPVGHKWERYVTCALAARYIYKLDQHYVVRQEKIVLIDESTGRMMPGRQLPDGIHQAIEVFNNIAPTSEIKGNYQTTYQTFFRKYKKLAGMTGTATIASREFLHVYNQRIVPIPTNKPSRREIHPDLVYRNKSSKFDALIQKICEIHETGRPILIGTGSVLESEHVGQLLEEQNLPHAILNAKNHAKEAEIITNAGQRGTITVITNMAGRGVDIKLGEGIAEIGGMYLFSTDRLSLRRIDQQLTGRVGRQGDPGDCQFYLSLRDDLMRSTADYKKKIAKLRIKTRKNRKAPISDPAAANLFKKAQSHLNKISSNHRKMVFRNEKHREQLRSEGMWQDWMDMR
ncbi:MAG: preprotein translocase subunit SecA [Phycisphaerae bacterium]|nr:preprotein translocase subunit SecA [Phycisphaerae bacterium]